MLRFIMRRIAASMRVRYGYDGSYMEEVAAVSTGGALRLMVLPLLSQYRGAAPIDLAAGAAVASTREGDCGPCLQLAVDMALQEGASAVDLRRALAGEVNAAGEVGLGYRFARAAIADSDDLAALRDEITARYGQAAVVALSISAATARSWPVIKRGLGHGQACSLVTVGDVAVEAAA